jgi:mercuric ion transport protein
VTGTTEGIAEAAAHRGDAAGLADGTRRKRIAAAGGVFGAIAASSCCIVPLLMFSVGAGGVWIGNLAALAPYQPIFLAITFGFLGYGFYLVYRKPKPACDADTACSSPVSNRVVKGALWSATVLAGAALGFPWYAPLLLDY